MWQSVFLLLLTKWNWMFWPPLKFYSYLSFFVKIYFWIERMFVYKLSFIKDKSYLFKSTKIWSSVFFCYDLISPESTCYEWEMFNCSNCDSSKKLVDTKIQLFDTIQADVKNSDNWSKIKNHLPQVYWKSFSSSFTFRQKLMTAQITTGRQKFWKMSTAQHNL